MTTMYKIYAPGSIDTPMAPLELLAIMPMSTMKKVFALHQSAALRILQETQCRDNGVCGISQVFFRHEFPGFGTKVIVQEFDVATAVAAMMEI